MSPSIVGEERHSRSNHVLTSLPDSDLAAISPLMKRVELSRGAVLVEAGDAIETVYFPVEAMISLVVSLESGQMIEAGLVGCTGMLGGACLAAGIPALCRWVVQIPGGCLLLPAERFRAAAAAQPRFALVAARHELLLLAQAQQSCACNAAHTVDARLATWLLRCSDLLTSEDIPLTQEFLAEMLGLQRTTVSLAATALQRGGIIQYRRGHIEITDRAALRLIACECYAAMDVQRARIFGQPDALS